jgi:hypothetical protein
MGTLLVKYNDQTPVTGAKVYYRDKGTGREGILGSTDANGMLLVVAPPFWYTRGTYDLVVDAGNVRVGTFWGYFLGIMTPDMLVVHITKSEAPPIQGDIDYPTYHEPTDDSWGLLVIVLIVGFIATAGFIIIDSIEDWLQRR